MSIMKMFAVDLGALLCLLCVPCLVLSSSESNSEETSGTSTCVTAFAPSIVQTTCPAGSIGCSTFDCISSADGSRVTVGVCATAAELASTTNVCLASGPLNCCTQTCLTGSTPCNRNNKPIDIACDDADCGECERCVPQSGPTSNPVISCVPISGCVADSDGSD